MVHATATATYPTSVVTDADIGVFTNVVTTTLTADVTDAATSFTVNSATDLSIGTFLSTRGANGYEIVRISAISGTTLTVVRAQDGTTAVAHSTGQSLRAVFHAKALNQLREEVQAVQTQLGATGSQNFLRRDGTNTMTGHLSPTTTRLYDLGSSTLYWDDLYATKVLGMVDVRAYGAIGDDSTDDTAALQAAHDALPAAGGVLYVPVGTYRFTTWSISKPTIIVGSGGGVTASATILKHTGSGVAVDVATGARGTHIRDLQLRTLSGAGTIGIRLNCNEPRIENVYIYDTTGAGFAGFSTAAIQAGSSSQVNDLLLRDVYIRQQPADGLQLLNVSEGTIDHCSFVQCQGDGVQVGDATNDSNNINFVNGTRFGSANVAGSRCIRVVRAPYRMLVDECYFESDNVNGANYAIDTDGAVGGQVDSIIVRDSYFVGNSFGANAAYAIRGNVSGLELTVAGCSFRNYATAAITTGTMNGIRVEDNIVLGTTAPIVDRYTSVRRAHGNPTVTVANLATFSLGATVLGELTVVDRTNGYVGTFQMRGGSNTVTEIDDPSNNFDVTAGTANRINVYYSAGNARYEIENRLGSQVVISLVLDS